MLAPPDPPRPKKRELSPADEAFLAKVAATPAPSRSYIRVQNLLLFVAAAIFIAEVFYWWGGLRAAPRPTSLIVETALGAGCIAAVALWATLGKSKSMVGRSATFLGIAGLATPAALFVWKVFWSAQEHGMMDLWPTRPGFKCLRLSLTMGALPLIAMALVRRNSDPNHPRLTGASLGIAAGAVAWVFTDLWCPVAYIPHLLLGHVLPMTVLAAVGALLGHWLIGVRAPPKP